MAKHTQKCPHCNEAIHIKGSYQENPILRRVYWQCSNLECGFTAQGFLEMRFELSPSAIPNPEINLSTKPTNAVGLSH